MTENGTICPPHSHHQAPHYREKADGGERYGTPAGGTTMGHHGITAAPVQRDEDDDDGRIYRLVEGQAGPASAEGEMTGQTGTAHDDRNKSAVDELAGDEDESAQR